MPTKKRLLADESISDVYQEYLLLEKEVGKKKKKGKETPQINSDESPNETIRTSGWEESESAVVSNQTVVLSPIDGALASTALPRYVSEESPTDEVPQEHELVEESNPTEMVTNKSESPEIESQQQSNTRYQGTEEDSPTVPMEVNNMITTTVSNEEDAKDPKTAPSGDGEQVENSRYSAVVISPSHDDQEEATVEEPDTPLDNNTAPTLKSRKNALAAQLNTWKASYTETHGSAPTKSSLRNDPSISSVYAEYEQVMKELKESKQDKVKKKKTPSRKAVVIKQLNEWKANFEKEHGKVPTKKDMNTGDDDIRTLYSEYLELSKK